MTEQDAYARLDADQEKAAKREETIGELKGWLEDKHRAALEENPYGRFVSRIPVELLANLSPVEREQIDAFEEGAFDRHQPIAQLKHDQRRAFVAAGGTEAAFEDHWRAGGRDASIAEIASENLERARQEDQVF